MTIAVVVLSREPRRVGEALRAAVGLGLRGDRVNVVCRHPASAPEHARPLATLRALGCDVCGGPTDDPAIAAAVRAADRVEVWT